MTTHARETVTQRSSILVSKLIVLRVRKEMSKTFVAVQVNHNLLANNWHTILWYRGSYPTMPLMHPMLSKYSIQEIQLLAI
jgi:hypothetical protein